MWFWASVAVGATLDVGAGQPYETLQAAVDAAASGDELLLHDSLIEGDVHLPEGLQLTLRAQVAAVCRGSLYLDGQLVISDLAWEAPEDVLLGTVRVTETGTLELQRVTVTDMGFDLWGGQLTVSESTLVDSWVLA